MKGEKITQKDEEKGINYYASNGIIVRIVNEEWRPIEGTNGNYEVSNYGRVGSSATSRYGERILIQQICRRYPSVVVVISDQTTRQRKRIKVHRLVAKAFIPIPEEYKNLPEDKLQVNHIDEDPCNNRVWNLEWSDQIHNINHGTCRQRINEKQNHPVSQFNKKGEWVFNWDSVSDASRALGYDTGAICAAANGVNPTAYGNYWKYTKPIYKEGFKLNLAEEYYNRRQRPVVVLDPITKELIKEFSNACEAERTDGIHPAKIIDNEEGVEYRGFIYTFKDRL